MLQYAGGTGLFLNGLQFVSLFPGHEGLLTGVTNALVAIGTLIPQLWLVLITKMEVLTFNQVLFIWMGMALLSFLAGFIVYPWNNLSNNVIESSDYDSFYQKYKKKERFCGNQSNFWQQFRQSLVLLKSPIFVIHVIMFAAGNCTATISLNFVNGFMLRVK